jgi:hypothetical protein
MMGLKWVLLPDLSPVRSRGPLDLFGRGPFQLFKGSFTSAAILFLEAGLSFRRGSTHETP